MAIPSTSAVSGADFASGFSSAPQTITSASLVPVSDPGIEWGEDGTATVSWMAPTVRSEVAPEYAIERTVGGSTERLSPAVGDVTGARVGFTDDLTTPAIIEGKKVSDIAPGTWHTCALTSDGYVYCWGTNGRGELGNDAVEDSSVPLRVSAPLPQGSITAIAAGEEHNCALTSDGTVYCWGYNSYGQLGTGDTISRGTAVRVEGALLDETVIAIGAGSDHTCAVTSDGHVYCWGYNSSGQIGVGQSDVCGELDAECLRSPTLVEGALETRRVTGLALGYEHSCALTDETAIYCWGYNYYGLLGDGTTTNSRTPVLVGGALDGARIVAVDAGGYHTCALTDDATAYCWGNNSYGQLGDGTQSNSSTPVQVATLPGGPIIAIGAGGWQTCAIAQDSAGYCWGSNRNGELGIGSNIEASVTPQPVGGPLLGEAIATIASGDAHSCAVTVDGAAYCWGWNPNGQVGDGTRTPSTTKNSPVSVTVAAGGLGVSACPSGWDLVTPAEDRCSPGEGIEIRYEIDYTKAGWSPSAAAVALTTTP